MSRKTFLDCCKNGDINEIKKMQTVPTGIQMINYNLDTGFWYSVCNRHYNLARYICELYAQNISNIKMVNIHYNDEYDFRWAYCFKEYKICAYMLKLYRNHKYTPINNYLNCFRKFKTLTI